jgi:mannose-6-phosphate isomerase-like protein (cupin superfamily)
MDEKDSYSLEDIEEFKRAIIEDIRPWGKFRAFPHQNAGSIKIITVNPGASLSFQYHHKRSEFWIALDEGLEVTVGDRTWRPRKNEEIYIPKKAPHRMSGVGKEPARVMEIWIGSSEESDIVRLEDKYGRS